MISRSRSALLSRLSAVVPCLDVSRLVLFEPGCRAEIFLWRSEAVAGGNLLDGAGVCLGRIHTMHLVAWPQMANRTAQMVQAIGPALASQRLFRGSGSRRRDRRPSPPRRYSGAFVIRILSALISDSPDFRISRKYHFVLGGAGDSVRVSLLPQIPGARAAGLTAGVARIRTEGLDRRRAVKRTEEELQPASHGEYLIILRNGVRLQSSRSYHEKVKALTLNPV